MYPILFQFGPITIYSFGVFMALAALTAAWVVSSELKRRGYNAELASTMVFAAAIGGLVGARLLFIVEEWNNFLAAPWNYIFTGAGFTWYGGFFGGADFQRSRGQAHTRARTDRFDHVLANKDACIGDFRRGSERAAGVDQSSRHGR